MNDKLEPDLNLDSQQFYDDDAEWYAACSGEWLDPQRTKLATLLPSQTTGGTVVDIGAGVGAMLDVYSQAGARRIYAIEPSTGMRIGLTSYVALTQHLAQVTTVIPGTLDDALPHLPEQWDVATFLNVHGHLTTDQEFAVWQTVAKHLRPGGRFIVGLQPPSESVAFPETHYGTTSLGERTWSISGYAEPVDEQHVRWVTKRSVADPSGTTVRPDHLTTCLWRVGSPDKMNAMAREVNLTPLEPAATTSSATLDDPTERLGQDGLQEAEPDLPIYAFTTLNT